MPLSETAFGPVWVVPEQGLILHVERVCMFLLWCCWLGLGWGGEGLLGLVLGRRKVLVHQLAEDSSCAWDSHLLVLSA